MIRPEIDIRLDGPGDRFQPGDVLIAQYSVDVLADKPVSAVESSVIWTTNGTGEEDYGVHFFERRPKQTLDSVSLRKPHRISTVLPASPLSYNGQIIKLHWCVRIRVFCNDQQYIEDLTFRLGSVSVDEYETIESDSI